MKIDASGIRSYLLVNTIHVGDKNIIIDIIFDIVTTLNYLKDDKLVVRLNTANIFMVKLAQWPAKHVQKVTTPQRLAR